MPEYINNCKRGFILPDETILSSEDGKISHANLLSEYKEKVFDKDPFFKTYYTRFKNKLNPDDVERMDETQLLELYTIQILGWIKVGIDRAGKKMIIYPDIPEDTENYLTYRFVQFKIKNIRNLHYENVSSYKYLADAIRYDEEIPIPSS